MVLHSMDRGQNESIIDTGGMPVTFPSSTVPISQHPAIITRIRAHAPPTNTAPHTATGQPTAQLPLAGRRLTHRPTRGTAEGSRPQAPQQASRTQHPRQAAGSRQSLAVCTAFPISHGAPSWSTRRLGKHRTRRHLTHGTSPRQQAGGNP